LWERHEAAVSAGTLKRFFHPLAGPLTLDCQILTSEGNITERLVVVTGPVGPAWRHGSFRGAPYQHGVAHAADFARAVPVDHADDGNAMAACSDESVGIWVAAQDLDLRFVGDDAVGPDSRVVLVSPEEGHGREGAVLAEQVPAAAMACSVALTRCSTRIRVPKWPLCQDATSLPA
jgi:MmyB-like transcription regulator ligand binding domain